MWAAQWPTAAVLAVSPVPIALAVVAAFGVFAAWLPLAIRESRRPLRFPGDSVRPAEPVAEPMVAPRTSAAPPVARPGPRPVIAVARVTAVAPAPAPAVVPAPVVAPEPAVLTPAAAHAAAAQPIASSAAPFFPLPGSPRTDAASAVVLRPLRRSAARPRVAAAAPPAPPTPEPVAAHASSVPSDLEAATDAEPVRHMRVRVALIIAALVLWSRWTASHRSRVNARMQHD